MGERVRVHAWCLQFVAQSMVVLALLWSRVIPNKDASLCVGVWPRFVVYHVEPNNLVDSGFVWRVSMW